MIIEILNTMLNWLSENYLWLIGLIFYCYFKGNRYWKKSLKRFLPFGYPYKEIIYYRESKVYHEGGDPVDMKYHFINEPITKK